MILYWRLEFVSHLFVEKKKLFKTWAFPNQQGGSYCFCCLVKSLSNRTQKQSWVTSASSAVSKKNITVFFWSRSYSTQLLLQVLPKTTIFSVKELHTLGQRNSPEFHQQTLKVGTSLETSFFHLIIGELQRWIFLGAWYWRGAFWRSSIPFRSRCILSPTGCHLRKIFRRAWLDFLFSLWIFCVFLFAFWRSFKINRKVAWKKATKALFLCVYEKHPTWTANAIWLWDKDTPKSWR